ncbi:MAG: hypothetical protein J6U12_03160 [Candidatus Methanomethylophilaceae archaeon]|nr:hypothetical protein [Candidatus Methanomethylophilaceae archaeon]MBP5685995.1 hypothetical protein [Candidatus Methanomethylophilaceae archaeon]MBP5735446.1 hypothetical protein [Candidatus Methanomethylophilaceae archaeon]
MKFSIARLCGGQALMAVSVDPMDIDMEAAAEKIASEGLPIQTKDDQMIVYTWNGMETTLYKPGKVMFFPLSDKATCIKYATEILEQYQ